MEHQLILDRYRPLEQLGEGASGSVTLAWDTRMQRRVAIKRMPLPLDDTGRAHRGSGLHEARTAAMLSHPGVVTVFDFDTDSDEAFLVMEHVDGASLAEVLDASGGTLTFDEAASVVSDVCSALDHAHNNGVLHLDLKPENILITRAGRAKIADFGVAGLSSLGGHGSAAGGTLGYMPLEQLSGEPVSEATDEWALAIVVYELLTGENPYRSPDTESGLAALRGGDPALPSSRNREVPREIDDVLLAALAPEPEQRYVSVAAFGEALLTYLGDPAEGYDALADIVAELVDDDYEDEAPGELGLWDRLQGPLGVALLRTLAAVESAWLAWSGLRPFALEPLALSAAVLLVTVAAAFSPGLGIGLGLGCLVAGLARAGLVWLALLVALVGGAWWWFMARRSSGAAVLPLSAPVLAFARVAFVQPLLAGFALAPLRAALTALLGGGLTMLASAASGHGAPYLAVWPGWALDMWNVTMAAESVRALLSSPAALMALLGWPAAAAFMSVACARATRASAAVGALGGAALLALAYYLAERIALTMGYGLGYTSTLAIVSLSASLILVVLISLLGAPIRAEEEDPFALATQRPEDGTPVT